MASRHLVALTSLVDSYSVHPSTIFVFESLMYTNAVRLTACIDLLSDALIAYMECPLVRNILTQIQDDNYRTVHKY